MTDAPGGDLPCEFGDICVPTGAGGFVPGAVPWGSIANWGVRIGGWADAGFGSLFGLLLMQTGDNAPHQMSNLSENRKFGYAIQEIERRCGRPLDKGERRRIHDEITGQGYSVPDIIAIGVGMFCPGN